MKTAMTPVYTRHTPSQENSGMITLTAGLIMCLLLGIMVIFAGCTPPKPKVETSRDNLFHDPLQMFNGVPVRMTYKDVKNAPPVQLSREKIERIRRQVLNKIQKN